MHKVVFYPVGNGDTSQIILANGKRLLFDFRHQQQGEGEENPLIDLKAQLRSELSDAKRDDLDVVAFTHGDRDHICRSTEFFELLHAEKYQGEGRIKIKELWVPAAMILETASNGEQSEEFVIWRQEARYRLKNGTGIRVFSKPDKLKEWCEENDVPFEQRKHLMTDAGQLVPGFTLAEDGVEFFCHSPFIKHVDDHDEFRNEASLILNIRFLVGGAYFDYLAVGDTNWEILEDIVEASQNHGNGDRLAWDLFNVPHHCSYLALSDDKGVYETVPKDKIAELLLMGKEGAYLVSSSNPIPDTKEGREQAQPPHIQARKCYQTYLDKIDGAKLLVTMEEPNASKPEPLVFKIEATGLSLDRKAAAAAAIITSRSAPRAG